MSHGEQNDDVSATAAAAAVVLGVGDGVRHVIKDKEDQASRLITPGDQRHIPHPVDDFVAGISGAWQKLTTPADMNIKHSMHPVDALNDAHEALVRATADNFAAKGLTQGLRELSAFATAAAIENVDPFKKFNALENIAEVANTADAAVHAEQAGKVLQVGAKVTPIPIDWNTYEHLLGQGSQPPKLKPLRDFSGLMHYRPPGPFEGFSRLEYVPYPNQEVPPVLDKDNAQYSAHAAKANITTAQQDGRIHTTIEPKASQQSSQINSNYNFLNLTDKERKTLLTYMAENYRKDHPDTTIAVAKDVMLTQLAKANYLVDTNGTEQNRKDDLPLQSHEMVASR